MPSFININLPSYYAEEFPTNVSQWKIARETSRFFMGQPTVNKMRVMEWAVKGLYRLDDNAALTKAAQIAEAERILPITQQNLGNLLAVLKSKVGTGIKDHEQIEEMFKFIIGILPAKNNSLFNTLLNITVDYARWYNIVLPSNVYAYDAQHREMVETLLLRLRLAPASTATTLQNVTTLGVVAPTFTPLADQTLATAQQDQKPDEDKDLEAALALSLQDDETADADNPAANNPSSKFHQ